MTLRMTSPASIARKASFTSSSLMVFDTIDGDVEAAGLDQLDEAREVAPHLRRAVLAALHRLLLEEDAERGQRELRVEARHADDDDLAAAARDVVGREDRLGEADHLERVVGAAAAGERLHLLDRIALRRVDDVGRAELLRGLALQRLRVDRDDAARARRCARPGSRPGRRRRSRGRRRSSPGLTCAVLSAAPTPVVTPQPMSASCSSGRSVSTFTTDASSTVMTLGERAEAGHAEVRAAVGPACRASPS